MADGCLVELEQREQRFRVILLFPRCFLMFLLAAAGGEHDDCRATVAIMATLSASGDLYLPVQMHKINPKLQAENLRRSQCAILCAILCGILS